MTSATKEKGRLKGKAPFFAAVCYEKNSVLMVEVVVVIMVIPITIGVPAVGIFVPPAVLVLIAISASFREFVAPVLGLLTLPAMVFDRLVQLMVCLLDALLAILLGAYNRRGDEKKSRRKRRGSERVLNPFCCKSHGFSKVK